MSLSTDIPAALKRRRPGTGKAAGGRTSALPVSPNDFCGWLAMAEAGDTTVYYRGQLGRDRRRSAGALAEPDRQRLIALARQALLAAEDGRVHLVQRRHGAGDYSYVAIKARTSAGRGSPRNGSRPRRQS
jgi:hypothetical protein